MAELKLELKLRGLPVSGTKTDLIERLKPFQENAGVSAPPASSTTSSVPMEVTAPTIVLPVQQVAPEATCSTPPNSPTPSDQSLLLQDVSMSEAPSELQQGGSGSPQRPLQVPEEKDRRLHEKERQIEELMRKLEQEQRLVEELKMQLEVEKRGQADPASPVLPSVSSAPAILTPSAVKMEGPVRSTCSASAHPQVVKLEDVTVSAGQPLQLFTQIQNKQGPQNQNQPAAPSLQQFFIAPPAAVSQVLAQPQTLLTTAGQPATQIFVPVSLPNSAIQLPSADLSLQVRTPQQLIALTASHHHHS